MPELDVRLRPMRPEDLSTHFGHQLDPVANAMAAVPARDRAAFDAHFAKILADPDCTLRTVVAGGQVVGDAATFPMDGRRWVGYRIGREHWGKGYASAALTLLLEEEPQRPLHATVAEHNGGSLRVLEKHGFRRVGGHRGDDGVPLVELRLD